LRKVILHYHLFKNAGTSLDAAFKENFSEEKGEWVTKEFPNQPAANREQVRQWILDNPQAKCFSSHTAIFPVPEFEDIEVFPVIFVRHPIDRIASAYSFEKNQKVDTFGSVLARNTDLKGYIETRLALPHDRQCRDFHAHRFAANNIIAKGEYDSPLKEIDNLPFIGLVERYEESLELLETKLVQFGFEDISFKVVKQNVSQDSKLSVSEKVEKVRDKLGEELYSRLLADNSTDFDLYNLVKERFENA